MSIQTKVEPAPVEMPAGAGMPPGVLEALADRIRLNLRAAGGPGRRHG